MAADLSPAAVARMHVLDRMAEHAEYLASVYRRAADDALDARDVAYLTNAEREAGKLAARLRSSRGAA